MGKLCSETSPLPTTNPSSESTPLSNEGNSFGLFCLKNFPDEVSVSFFRVDTAKSEGSLIGIMSTWPVRVDAFVMII